MFFRSVTANRRANFTVIVVVWRLEFRKDFCNFPCTQREKWPKLDYSKSHVQLPISVEAQVLNDAVVLVCKHLIGSNLWPRKILEFDLFSRFVGEHFGKADLGNHRINLEHCGNVAFGGCPGCGGQGGDAGYEGFG